MKTSHALLCGVVFASGVSVSFAAPLKSATVAEIRGDVGLQKSAKNERPAVVKDVVDGQDVLRTGKKSRAELEFTDKSLARLGSNTIFSFDPKSRDMNLKQGTALIHVPPGKNGARISTPAATASILGDVVAMRVNGKGDTQIIALSKDADGPITVTLNSNGEKHNLNAGEMFIIAPGAMSFPEPMAIAVDVFVQSSGLASGFKQELPASAKSEIRQTEQIQAKEVSRGALESRRETIATDPIKGIRVGGDNTNLIQATSSRGFAGRYIITTVDGPGCSTPGQVSTGSIDVTDDGRISGLTSSGEAITGLVNTDGTFTASGGTGTASGTVVNGSIRGIVAHQAQPGCFEALSGSKQ